MRTAGPTLGAVKVGCGAAALDKGNDRASGLCPDKGANSAIGIRGIGTVEHDQGAFVDVLLGSLGIGGWGCIRKENHQSPKSA